jgi:hypothetical protein
MENHSAHASLQRRCPAITSEFFWR